MEEYQKIYVPEQYDLTGDLTVYYLQAGNIGIVQGCPDTMPIVDVYNSDYNLITRQILETDNLLFSTNCETAFHVSEFTHSTSATANFAQNMLISGAILIAILALPVWLFRKGYRRV